MASWIVWTGPTDGPISLEFRHNLLVEVGAVGPNVRALAAAGRDPPTFLGNVVVNQNDLEAGEFASLAMEDPDFPLLSTQPSDPHYLQPDFARLKLGAGASGPTPGRYSPDSSP